MLYCLNYAILLNHLILSADLGFTARNCLVLVESRNFEFDISSKLVFGKCFFSWLSGHLLCYIVKSSYFNLTI